MTKRAKNYGKSSKIWTDQSGNGAVGFELSVMEYYEIYQQKQHKNTNN